MSISKKLRFTILMRDGFTCKYCGKKADAVQLFVDHIIPRSRHGSDDLDNLTTACFDCNSGKGDCLLPEHDLGKLQNKAAAHLGCRPDFIGCFAVDLLVFVEENEGQFSGEMAVKMTAAMFDALAHESMDAADNYESNDVRLKSICTIVMVLLKMNVYEEKEYPDALSYFRAWAEHNKNERATEVKATEEIV